MFICFSFIIIFFSVISYLIMMSETSKRRIALIFVFLLNICINRPQIFGKGKIESKTVPCHIGNICKEFYLKKKKETKFISDTRGNKLLVTPREEIWYNLCVIYVYKDCIRWVRDLFILDDAILKVKFYILKYPLCTAQLSVPS